APPPAIVLFGRRRVQLTGALLAALTEPPRSRKRDTGSRPFGDDPSRERSGTPRRGQSVPPSGPAGVPVLPSSCSHTGRDARDDSASPRYCASRIPRSQQHAIHSSQALRWPFRLARHFFAIYYAKVLPET